MDDIAIRVDNVSKTFKLPHEKYTSLKSIFVNFYKRKRSYELQKALNGVSFDIKKGEFFGIVGRNGSGKSTLLKMIAGIYAPTNGEININGSLTPFIELGVGFNKELTGRENVFLNGALLGFNRKQMQAMYKDIVEFAELEKFMDQKLKNYSSGMQVRLAFSIAIRAESDILLLDEVLAVGDAAFQQKCYDYFSKLKSEKRTIILVSHSMTVIEQYCDKALLLENGTIKHMGDAAEISSLYSEMFLKEETERLKKERGEQSAWNHSGLKVQSCKVFQSGKQADDLIAKKDFEVHVTVHSGIDLDHANVGINIKNRDKMMLVSTDTEAEIGEIPLKKGKYITIVFKIENILSDGVYTINIGIADVSKEVSKLLLRQDNAQTFSVHGIGRHYKSLTHPKVKVEIK